jgi:multiple sugar transport system permease protein
MLKLSHEVAKIKYTLVIPAIIILLIFTVYPFIYQFYLSFTNASLYNYREPSFVGIGNYIYILYEPGYFWHSGLITTIYVGLAVAGQMLLGMLMALLVYPLKKSRKVVTSIFLFPLFTAPVFLGALGRLVFNSMIGVVPYYLRTLGLPSISLTDPIHALLVVIALEVWKWTPFAFIIMYAGLESIPPEIFDAAKVDGASKFQNFIHITIPMMKSIIAILLMIRIMDELKAFDIPFILLEGGPGSPVGATTTLSLLTYRVAFSFNNFGAASTINIAILFILLGLFWLLMNKFLRRG